MNEATCLTCLNKLRLDWIPDTGEGGGGVIMASCSNDHGINQPEVEYLPVKDPLMLKGSKRLMEEPRYGYAINFLQKLHASASSGIEHWQCLA